MRVALPTEDRKKIQDYLAGLIRAGKSGFPLSLLPPNWDFCAGGFYEVTNAGLSVKQITDETAFYLSNEQGNVVNKLQGGDGSTYVYGSVGCDL